MPSRLAYCKWLNKVTFLKRTARTVEWITLKELMNEEWCEIITKPTVRKNKTIPNLLENTKLLVHFPVHKWRLLNSILNQINSIHTLTPCSFISIFNIIFPSPSKPFRLPDQNCVDLCISDLSHSCYTPCTSSSLYCHYYNKIGKIYKSSSITHLTVYFLQEKQNENINLI